MAGVLLQGAGVNLQELDWMVCNGGADIWHLLQTRGGKEPKWSSDEHWDAHIAFRQALSPCTPFRPLIHRQRTLVEKTSVSLHLLYFIEAVLHLYPVVVRE